MVDELLIQRDLTSDQRMLFQSEMSRMRKDPTVALLLCLFFGGVGAHHFYLGNIGLGVLYLLFCWTLIPAIIAFFELFFVMQRTRDYNSRLALQVFRRVRLFSNAAEHASLPTKIYCTRCGTPMVAGANFCSACGAGSHQKALESGDPFPGLTSVTILCRRSAAEC